MDNGVLKQKMFRRAASYNKRAGVCKRAKFYSDREKLVRMPWKHYVSKIPNITRINPHCSFNEYRPHAAQNHGPAA